MKIAVFGGAGFLGSYLIEELTRRKHEVFCCDIQEPRFSSDAQYIPSNIMDKEKVEQTFEKYQFDVVFNLAGFANLDKAIQAPYETIQLNVTGNLNILEAARKFEVKRYVYASSAYAMSDKGTFYGISKLSSEKIIKEYGAKFDLPYTILRYGSIYSERDFDNNYIFNLIRRAVNEEKIIHPGDGEEIREYIHARDAAKLSADIIEDDSFLNEYLTLTGVERMKRSELFQMINEILGGKITVELKNSGYHNHYKYTPYSFSPEESKKLVPNPYIDMGQGILNCIKEVHKK